MPGSRRQNFKAVIKRVLRAPFSVVVLSLGVLIALLNHGAPGLAILAASVGAVAAYAAIKLQDESFIRAAIREAGERQRQDDLMERTFRIEELDVESRVRMKTIVSLQSEIAEDVINSPVDEVATGLSETVEKTEAIVERGLALSRQRRELEKYLRKTDEGAIVARVESLEAKLTDEQDPIRLAELNASLASKRQELEDYRAIKRASARILDQLDSIECSFSSLKAGIVRIRSTDIAEWVSANEELQTELGTLNEAVDTLEHSISEALTIGNSVSDD
jgi:hypothetical protein